MVHVDNSLSIPTNLSTLRMENEDATVTFTNTGPALSTPGPGREGGWTKETEQNVNFTFTDTGGSLLNSYTLQVFDATDAPSYASFASAGTA